MKGAPKYELIETPGKQSMLKIDLPVVPMVFMFCVTMTALVMSIYGIVTKLGTDQFVFMIEIVKQIDQICGRTVYRTAVFAITNIELPKQ